MAEQADAPDLKSVDTMYRGGSIPPAGTTFPRITFMGVPIHVCEKVPKDKPYIVDGGFSHCPFCGDKI